MRKGIRLVGLFLLGLFSTAVMGAVAALMSAISLAATALIVPGTGTPDANNVEFYREHFVDRYSAPFNPSCTSTNGCNLQGIDYPASFFPLIIFPTWCQPGRCDTWNDSVGQGVDGLVGAVQNLTDPDGALVLGYSQGGAVVSDALRRLAENPELLEKVAGVVLIGNAYNPDGGLFTRFGFLPTIPFLDITFGPATPVELAEDIGKAMDFIGYEFDPVMYAPVNFGNVLALINAFAAFEDVHGYYLTPDGNGPDDPIAYGYSEDEIAEILDGDCPGANCRVDSYGNRYWMLPAKGLPMYNLLLSSVPAPLDALIKPLVDLVTPATEVLIKLGYDWSGDPGKTRWATPLPFNLDTNWIQVGVDLIGAIGEGIENAFGGGTTMIAPPEPEVLAFGAQQRSFGDKTSDEAIIDESTDPPADETTGPRGEDELGDTDDTGIDDDGGGDDIVMNDIDAAGQDPVGADDATVANAPGGTVTNDVTDAVNDDVTDGEGEDGAVGAAKAPGAAA
ncbi:PE-PPE domain-containing protein [Mycolicibacterium sp. XJ1819]